MPPLAELLRIPFEPDFPTRTHKCYSLVRRIPGQLRIGQKPGACLSLPASNQKVTVIAALRAGCGAAEPPASSHVRELPQIWTFDLSLKGGIASYTPNRFERSSSLNLTWTPYRTTPACKALGINLLL